MRTRTLIALVCLFVLCCGGAGVAWSCEIIAVPGDAACVTDAIAMAHSGDIIEVALGRHKIVGGNHLLKAGITIRNSIHLPGACVFEEVAAHPGDWREQPVFVLEQAGTPCRFEGITFRNWNLADGPLPDARQPIFNVLEGRIIFEACQWQDFQGEALRFDGGLGELHDCEFAGGSGWPSAVFFAGQELKLDRCLFRHNTGYDAGQGWEGVVVQLRRGVTRMDDCIFHDNGPLTRVLQVDRGGTVVGCNSCLDCNDTMQEASVAGRAFLWNCGIQADWWVVLEGGELAILDAPAQDQGDGRGQLKAMRQESMSWSGVKSLFD